MLSPETAAHLTRTILSGADRAQADALCDLIKGIAGNEPPSTAPVEDRRRYDAVYAVVLAAFPMTSHHDKAVKLFLDLAA